MSLREVMDCMESGWSLDEIAEELDLPVDEVCKLTRLVELRGGSKSLPLPEQIADCRDGGLTWGEIAGLLQIDPDTARALRLRRAPGSNRSRGGRVKLPVTADLVRAARAQGKTWATLSTELGISANTLRSRLKEVAG